MQTILENVPSSAVWISIAANVLLATFMVVQTFVDPTRRYRFALFASVWAVQAWLGLMHPWFDRTDYETIRLAWAGLFAGSLLLLLEEPRGLAIAAATALPVLGLGLRDWGGLEIPSAVIYPVSFGIVAVAHGRQYLRSRGYASCVLSSLSTALALLCATYAEAVRHSDDRVLPLGYAHFVFLTVLCALFGWVQLPRELRGQAPVRLEKRHAALFFSAVLLGEFAVLTGQLWLFSWPPVLYVAATIFQFAAVQMLFFYHRHRLVIHTDNVSQLLEVRTQSLREAREALAKQNELQAQKLKDQAQEIQWKSQVIERQRRLELAAQTAGQAAHDIQNLIVPIQTHLYRLQREATSPGKVRESVGRMRLHLRQLLDLNSQLLTLSRRGRADFHPIRLADLIQEITQLYPGKPIQIRQEGDAWVLGAWSQLSRAVSNLLMNAFEAEPCQEDRVLIRYGIQEVSETRRCHLGFLGKGTHAFLSIEDTGPGIPEAIQEQIFEPFFSSKSGPKRSGSGLGLSIVAAVVDDHRGVLDLKTGPGGTRFIIFLPCVEPPRAAMDRRKLSGNETVMVLDDDSERLEREIRLFEEFGYPVIPVKDGCEALKVLQMERADLILANVESPSFSVTDTFFGAIHLRPGIRLLVISKNLTAIEMRRLRIFEAVICREQPNNAASLLRLVRETLGDPAGTQVFQN